MDIIVLANELAEELRLQGGEVQISGQAAVLTVKPLALKRCLANLLENAVFYGQRATVEVSDTPALVTLLIHDNGPGIAEDQLARVFSPFVRLEASRSRHTGGSGLGLGIARHIARAHGGDITLANHPEGGLVATLTLPRHAPVTVL